MMIKKFETTRWSARHYEVFVQVEPLSDVIEHGVGDECPCGPKVQRGGGLKVPLISHRLLREELSEEDRRGVNTPE